MHVVFMAVFIDHHFVFLSFYDQILCRAREFIAKTVLLTLAAE